MIVVIQRIVLAEVGVCRSIQKDEGLIDYVLSNKLIFQSTRNYFLTIEIYCVDIEDV